MEEVKYLEGIAICWTCPKCKHDNVDIGHFVGQAHYEMCDNCGVTFKLKTDNK